MAIGFGSAKNLELPSGNICQNFPLKKFHLLHQGKNLKISLFLNPMLDERGRCNLINDLNPPASLWLILEISLFKVGSKIPLGQSHGTKKWEKWSTFWSFQIPYHSTEVDVNQMIRYHIWTDLSSFSRFFIFQAPSSWPPEPCLEYEWSKI